MNSDLQLGYFANFLGISTFLMIVAYHYVAARKTTEQ